MKLTIAISALVLLGACVPDEFSQFNYSLESCGSQTGTGYTSNTFEPATDRGNGWVGLFSSSSTDTGFGQARFELLQCKSGAVISVRSNEPWAQYDGEQNAKPLSEFVVALEFNWDQGNVEEAQRFANLAKREGYQVSSSRKYSNSSRAVCACNLYYTDVERDWLTNSDEQLLAESQSEQDAMVLIRNIVDETLAGMGVGNEN